MTEVTLLCQQKRKAGRTQNKSKEQLIQENEEEDRIIKKLEKNLGYNKRKTKTIPMALKRDGFDCILFLVGCVFVCLFCITVIPPLGITRQCQFMYT